MIERSLRCFVCGLIGLLPIIGIAPALRAISDYRRVIKGRGDLWNPAHRYLVCGGFCARLGLGLFVLVPFALGLIVYLAS